MPRSGLLGDNCPSCLLRLSGVDLAGNAKSGPAAAALLDSGVIRRLGDYELIEEIARGGMGIVYRTRQVSLNRLAALKVLLATHAPSDAQRFRREAELAASLNHPNIVSIYEIGEHERQPYFSMELIEGQSLAEMTRESPLPAARAAQLVKTVAEAIHFAHQRGLLHRDLKPSNVIVDAFDVPHVTDFGLARRTEGDENLTVTGQVLGTPNYMPPEQADPQRGPAGAASDVYALGAILYQLLTGRAPFMAETLTQTLRLVTESEPISATLLNPRVPRDLETICSKCLEKEPERRYASAQELADELGRFLADEPIHARPISNAARLLRWSRRKPSLALSAGAAAVLLLVVLIGSPIAMVQINHAREAAEGARRQETTLRERAESAERQTQQQLYNALLEQARATLRSGELGQRVRALDALKSAAAISNSVELRREVLTALALPDLRLERELPYGSTFTLREPDPGFERIALSRGKAIEVRALSDQRLLVTLPASTNAPIHYAEWSSNGRFLAIKRDYPPNGSWAAWEVWDVTTAQRTLLLRDVPLAALAFHPTLPRLMVGNRSGEVVVRSLEEDREIARFAVGGVPFLLRYAPNGEHFAAGQKLITNWAVSVFEANSGAGIASHVFTTYPRDVQWHAAGRWLAVPDESGAVHSMDAQTGAMRLLGLHRAQAATVAFSPDGDWLLSGGWERELICWDARAMRRAFTIGLESYHLRFRRDGEACAVMRDSGIQYFRFERPTGHREFAENVGARLRHAAFSQDGRWLAVSADKGSAVWDLSRGGPAATDPEAIDARLFFTRDGSELFASRNRQAEGGDGFRWRLLPAGSNGAAPRMNRLPLHKPAGLKSLALSSGSVVLTSTNGSQILELAELETGSDRWTQTTPGISDVSPDGRWLGIFRPFSRSLAVYSMPGMELAAQLSHPADVGGLEFSPHGSELAVYSSRAVELWSTKQWQRSRTLTNFTQLLYTPDARTVWLGRENRSTGLHDALTLKPHLLLPPGMLPLALSADGRHLAVKVEGRRLLVWDLEEVRRQLRQLGLDWGEEQVGPQAATR